MGEIRHALNQALSEEFSTRKLTRKHIADILEVDKSFITKKFSGEGNMTLETLADLAFALDRPVKVTLPSRAPAVRSNLTETSSSSRPFATTSICGTTSTPITSVAKSTVSVV
jgi:transcriptional regulator with XRE-family HTH domain